MAKYWRYISAGACTFLIGRDSGTKKGMLRIRPRPRGSNQHPTEKLCERALIYLSTTGMTNF